MTPAPAHSLPRVLGVWMASAVVVGTVIGSGVFKKAHNVAENAPEFGLAISVWVVGGLLTIFGALAYAEIAVRYPRAGGNYVYLREAYGRGAGFMWGWVDFTIIRSASIAVLAYMTTEALHDALRQSLNAPADRTAEVLGFWTRQAMTVGVIALLTAINARGTRLGGGVQMFLTVLKLGSLAGLGLLPVAVYVLAPDAEVRPTTAHMYPAWPDDWSLDRLGKYGVALVGVLWAYHGWMNIGPIAEDVKNPNRNIPVCVCVGVLALTAIYVAVNVSYYATLSSADMADPAMGRTAVATEVCFRLLGPVGKVVASLILMTSVLGSLNGNILVAPRLLYAMAEDRLAPGALKKIHPVYRTPVPATVAYSAWACLLVLSLGALTAYRLPPVAVGGYELDLNLDKGKVPFDVLTEYAVFGALVFETLAVASIFVFRRRSARDGTPPPPYRCPGYPVVPVLYALVMVFVAVNMLLSDRQRAEAVIGLGFIAVGGAVYAVIARVQGRTTTPSPVPSPLGGEG